MNARVIAVVIMVVLIIAASAAVLYLRRPSSSTATTTSSTATTTTSETTSSVYSTTTTTTGSSTVPTTTTTGASTTSSSTTTTTSTRTTTTSTTTKTTTSTTTTTTTTSTTTSTTSVVKPSLSSYLSKKINGLLKLYSEINVSTTGIVISTLNGTTIYSLNPHKPLIPASNMKLLTTAAALKYLGPDYKFKTRFILVGKIINSTLLGDIIVRGTGDPTLVSGDWASEWAHKVAYLYDTEHLLDDVVKPLEKLGIRQVKGDIIIDDYYLDHQWVNPTWEKEDLSHWYAAQIGALGINRNIVLLELYPQPTGKVKIKVVPDIGYINVTFAGRVVKTSSDVKQWAVEVRELGTNNVKIVGDLPMDVGVYYLSVTVHDPGMYFGAVFKNVLESHGIKVLGSVKRANTTGWNNKTISIIELDSKPLKDIIKLMLKKSLNLYADHIFKVLGRKVIGQGSWSGGSQAVEKMLKDLGIMEKGVRIVDGSGLSRENRVTASLLANLLRIYAGNKYLYDSLPIAGWDGTLRHRMKDTPAQGNLRAKTGTLTGVSALSGYVRTRDNVTLVFSIIFNGFHTSAHKIKYEVEDYIGAMLADIDTSKYNVP